MNKTIISEKSLNKRIRKLLAAYEARGVIFDIHEQVYPLPGNRIQLRVKFLRGTQLEAIKRHKDDVRRTLKLDLLEIEEHHDNVFIVISKQLDGEEFLLTNLLRSPIYREARRRMDIAVPIGIVGTGSPVVVDLCDSSFPHTLISGGTGSGKTYAIKSIAVSLLGYPPDKVNLILGDRANDMSAFKDLPHLSCPLIEDFDTLLGALLALKDEMDRRLSIKDTPEMCQSPFIIVLIDEFTSFMSEAPDKRRLSIAVDTLTQLLRRGRHTKIHFILGAYNPTKADMKINTADLPVRMAFKAANLHNSLTALGAGGC